MNTKDKLSLALHEVGLEEMSAKAATGWYHDFLSPLALPEMQLVADLAMAAEARPASAAAIMELRQRVIAGEFDASVEEADEWAMSAEGQDVFKRLVRRQ